MARASASLWSSYVAIASNLTQPETVHQRLVGPLWRSFHRALKRGAPSKAYGPLLGKECLERLRAGTPGEVDLRKKLQPEVTPSPDRRRDPALQRCLAFACQRIDLPWRTWILRFEDMGNEPSVFQTRQQRVQGALLDVPHDTQTRGLGETLVDLVPCIGRSARNPRRLHSIVSADSPVSSTTHLLITHTLSIWHTKPMSRVRAALWVGRCLCYTRFVAGSAMIVGTLPCGATETHGYAQMRRGMVDLFAVTTRGLETVSAAEMAALPGVIVGTTGYRRVTARVAAPDPALLTLRTIDDLFADVATWEAIGPERAALATMGTYSARIDLRPAAAVCGAVRGRPIRREPAFSVTASFVGRRNYTSDEIKLACARAIEDRHRGWTYTPDDRKADLNVRVFLEHATAHVGVRVGREPLQNRPYKQEHVPGSLRPPVAAAMVWLAGVLPGERVLDPCCGAGTLLVEPHTVEAACSAEIRTALHWSPPAAMPPQHRPASTSIAGMLAPSRSQMAR